VRLVLHTAAYWLMLTVRDAIPRPHPLATAEFTTLRMRLLKVAGRITEAATRVRIALAAACPRPRCSEASRSASSPLGRDCGAIAPHSPNPVNSNAVHEPDQHRDETGATPIRVRRSGSHPCHDTLNRTG
jgi:hypothetical protein